MPRATVRSFVYVVLRLCVVLVVVFQLRSFFSFYLAFERALLPTFFLILSWGYQPERVQARVYLMLYTVGARLPLLVLILSLWGRCGSTSFLLRKWALPVWWDYELCWLLLVGAFLVKMPLYCFHLWLPKAHVEAPVAGSMILAGVLLKLGGYGLFRVLGHVTNAGGLRASAVSGGAI